MGDRYEAWLDGAALLALASRESEHPLTERVLEDWRYRGLLPRPQRVGSPARWRYPPAVGDHLRALIRWRRVSARLDLLAIALWVEGHPVAVEDARAALLSVIARWESNTRAELARAGIATGDDARAGLEAYAGRLARMRSRAPVPKRVRMTLAERTRAYAYLLAHAWELEEEIARRAGDAVLAERMMGLRRGSSGGLAARFGPEALPVAPFTPWKVRATVEAASEARLEFVRKLAHVMIQWAPSILSEVDAEDRAAHDLVALAGPVLTDPHPEALAAGVVALLTKLPAPDQGVDAEISALSESFSVAAAGADILMSLPLAQRAPALRGLANPRP